jgi:VIT1/CCC1 family predicted Fe2+/Mn2+ transporter
VNTFLWVVSVIIASCALGAALLKLTQPRARIIEKGLTWAEDFTDSQVKLIGVAELLGAIGVILPPLLDTAEILAPLAATGLALLWAGAVVTHARRKEQKEAVPGGVLAILAVIVAVGGFGS